MSGDEERLELFKAYNVARTKLETVGDEETGPFVITEHRLSEKDFKNTSRVYKKLQKRVRERVIQQRKRKKPKVDLLKPGYVYPERAKWRNKVRDVIGYDSEEIVCVQCGEGYIDCRDSCYHRFIADNFVHKVELRRHPTMGYGAYAGPEVIIPKGAYVGEFLGQLKPYTQNRNIDKNYVYGVCIEKKAIADGEICGNWTRFINSSCQPNVAAVSETVGRRHVYLFQAKRDIEPGEELTFFYGKDYFQRADLLCGCPAQEEPHVPEQLKDTKAPWKHRLKPKKEVKYKTGVPEDQSLIRHYYVDPRHRPEDRRVKTKKQLLVEHSYYLHQMHELSIKEGFVKERAKEKAESERQAREHAQKRKDNAVDSNDIRRPAAERRKKEEREDRERERMRQEEIQRQQNEFRDKRKRDREAAAKKRQRQTSLELPTKRRKISAESSAGGRSPDLDDELFGTPVKKVQQTPYGFKTTISRIQAPSRKRKSPTPSPTQSDKDLYAELFGSPIRDTLPSHSPEQPENISSMRQKLRSSTDTSPLVALDMDAPSKRKVSDRDLSSDDSSQIPIIKIPRKKKIFKPTAAGRKTSKERFDEEFFGPAPPRAKKRGESVVSANTRKRKSEDRDMYAELEFDFEVAEPSKRKGGKRKSSGEKR